MNQDIKAKTILGTVAPRSQARPPTSSQEPRTAPSSEPASIAQAPTIPPSTVAQRAPSEPGAAAPLLHGPPVGPSETTIHGFPSGTGGPAIHGPAASTVGIPARTGPSETTIHGFPSGTGVPAVHGPAASTVGIPATPVVHGSSSRADTPSVYGGPSDPNSPMIGGEPRTSALETGGDINPFVGHELCGYTIKRKLADGGMGEVFEGEHGKIGRRAAIKVLKLELCRSDEAIERFHQEARAVNAIRHENIVDIYDFGRDPHGRVFFVMEYLDGEPLSSRIRRGALPWAEAFPILEQALRALKAAHDKGFVHRDLKPDNIWLRYVDGHVQVKLLDFGIAKLVGSDVPQDRLTRTGSVIGTPHYMSPEQINGSRDIDHRTDIYATGVITYEMFAGVTPFVGDTLQAIMTGHLFREPPRLTEIPADLGVPTPLAEIVDRMLVKDAAGRYDNVSDVISDLHDVNRNQQPAKAEILNRMRPTRAPALIATPAEVPRGRSKRKAVIAGVIAAAGLAITGVAIQQSQQVLEDRTPTPMDKETPVPTANRPLDYVAVRKDAEATLRASLREAEPAVRVQGTDALGKIRDQLSALTLTMLTEKDPDAEVRGHTGEALGTIGASAAAPLLAKLEASAPPSLKVWYASALARLDDKEARKRLLAYARDPDLAVSFKAALALADTSQPGDRQAIGALQALSAHEAKLNELAPYAGALILTRMAALRDAAARDALYALLERDHEGARLAAAEGLAKLGDEAGRKVLEETLADQASPNQFAAAVALIPLGEYGGFDLITTKLGDENPAIRRLAARALGEIGERKSLAALIALAGDKNWALRIAASAAIIAIVGLDPMVLAQASVDWTKSALDSQDWAMRQAGAGVLADIPEQDAVPLLALVIADKDPNVRLAAAKSAGRMQSPEAATKLAAAAKVELDQSVKEQQVKALGAIGSPTARDALSQLSDAAGRIGVIAAGSLIAVGDLSGKSKLEAAIAAPQPDLRLAAVQAASAAKNSAVVPILATGMKDRVFDVRFTAAEGLATFNAEKQAAVNVLQEALGSKDASVRGRAMAALVKFGAPIPGKAQTTAEMLEWADPKLRLTVVPVVLVLPSKESVPLLRRLVADPNPEVRRGGVDAIESVVTKDKGQAIKLYKLLLNDTDAVVRSKAAGQLARLVPPVPRTAAATRDDILPKVQTAANEASAVSDEMKPAAEALNLLVVDLTTRIVGRTHNDATLKQVEELATNIRAEAMRLEDVAAKVEVASNATAAAARGANSSSDAAKLVDKTKELAVAARDAAIAARNKATEAEKQSNEYKKKWTVDPQILITAADTAIATGDLADAKKNLDRASSLLRGVGEPNANLDYSHAQLYDKLATRTRDPWAKRKLLQQAAAAYNQFASTATGPRVQRAKNRATEIVDEIEDLGQP